jgi:hypothetical protein
MATLTTSDRKHLPGSKFAIPELAPGSGSYPIPDLAHARDALSRSSGKPEESRVRAAVYRRFPELKSTGKGYVDTSKADEHLDEQRGKRNEFARQRKAAIASGKVPTLAKAPSKYGEDNWTLKLPGNGYQATMQRYGKSSKQWTYTTKRHDTGRVEKGTFKAFGTSPREVSKHIRENHWAKWDAAHKK